MTLEPNESGAKGECRVCHGTAAGLYFGALVCLPCKSFYIRCTKDGVKLRCQQDPTACTVNKGRFKCQACRFQACLAAGMQRKEEKPDIIDAPAGSVMCKVCDDFANGVHFGVTSCEGCKKFFRRGLTEYQNYACKEGGNCPITPRTRNQCRYCRYMACLNAGMSREAIKVGRPPSKKENARHHPYGGQINLSTSHIDSNPKLVYNSIGGYAKQENHWQPVEQHSLASLPALIHGGGERFHRPPQTHTKMNGRSQADDLSISCNSADLNEMLLGVVGQPLPPHFVDLEEELAQMSGPQPQPKLQRIDNLPVKRQLPQSYPQASAAPTPMANTKANFQLHTIKSEHNTYRQPVQTYSHPSPPYEGTCDTYHSPSSMYPPSYPATQPSPGAVYNQPLTNQNTLAHQHRVITQSADCYPVPLNHNSPPHQSTAYDMSAASHPHMDQSSNQMVSRDNIQYSSPPHRPQAFTQPGADGAMVYGDMTRAHRPSCDLLPQQLPPQYDSNSPYSQQQYSPYSMPSSSPQSAITTSGYATDSQDLADEFSIYEVDIRQVNHKYMPSCSHEPLVFNEQALTIEDLWSSNTNSDEGDKEEVREKDEESDEYSGSGMFKHMKSINDKVNQDYWFKHKIPDDIEYGDDMKKEMEKLMKGWHKTREYVSSNLRTSSSNSTDYGKESLWPNVKENAPLQLKLMDFIKNRLLRETTAQARFYQEIHGSDSLIEKDKKTLVSTASFSNCLLMHVLYWWDEEREQCRYFWAWKIPEKDPFYVFRQTVLRYSRAINDLNFGEEEIMLISALTLFSTDILKIEQKEVIEVERAPLTDLCAAYMKDKYKENYKKRYREMLRMVPALRYLSIWHNDLMEFAKTFGPIKDRWKAKQAKVAAGQTSDYEHVSVNMIKQLQIGA